MSLNFKFLFQPIEYPSPMLTQLNPKVKAATISCTLSMCSALLLLAIE